MAGKKSYTEQELRDAARIVFFKPFPHQQRAFDLIAEGKKVILVQGGNRVGKTTFSVVTAASACIGVWPWIMKPTPWGEKGIRVRIISPSWEHSVKQVLLPELYKWLVPGFYTAKKNNLGVDYLFTFQQSGNTIEIMTSNQDPKLMEGWSGHVVIIDEPCSKDVFVANRRGLVDHSGTLIMAMTAVGTEKWILDDIALNPEPHIGKVTDIPMRANPILKKEDIDAFEKDTPEDEREARIYGGWVQLAGKILKPYKSEVHVIDPFKVPPDWPVTFHIDLHLSTPQFVGFYTIDKYDRLYAISEIWENLSPEELGDEIIRRKNVNGWRIDEALIDPLSKGDTAFMRNRGLDLEDSFSILERKLGDNGIRLIPGSKDKESGIRIIQQRLTGVNKMPSLFFTRDCLRHLYEIPRWVYDPNTQKPVKVDDHACESLYRVCISGFAWSDPKKFTGKLRYGKSGVV